MHTTFLAATAVRVHIRRPDFVDVRPGAVAPKPASPMSRSYV